MVLLSKPFLYIFVCITLLACGFCQTKHTFSSLDSRNQSLLFHPNASRKSLPINPSLTSVLSDFADALSGSLKLKHPELFFRPTGHTIIVYVSPEYITALLLILLVGNKDYYYYSIIVTCVAAPVLEARENIIQYCKSAIGNIRNCAKNLYE